MILRTFCRRAATGFQNASKKLKDRVEEQIRLENETKSRCAQYPHRILTRPCLALPLRDIRSPLMNSRIMNLNKMAMDLHALSFSAPKGHWDAQVILLKSAPDAKDFEAWVNPVAPGYDDRQSVAPMYGMWENCCSCGAATAWVIRPQSVTATGLDEYGNEKKEVLTGLRARLFMHELDHLHGKTILQQAVGPDFILSQSALAQRELWPANFPSAEAAMTQPFQFFDYVENRTVFPAGLEWMVAHAAHQQFTDLRIDGSYQNSPF